ncbi:MAG: hypothetical protein R3358_11460, partial [Woeseiaceae bacterium]|nr:hypothetical protein [Woeseiaceae bacterium]
MQSPASVTVLRAYYVAATLLFLGLDWLLDINVRVAFFENSTALRVLYYGALIGCAAITIWKPSLAALTGAVESLVSLVALILSMGMRTIIMTEDMLRTGAGVVTVPEIVNFAIVGFIGYYAWQRSMRELFGKHRP